MATTSLIQTPEETTEQWRDRVTDLFQVEFQGLGLRELTKPRDLRLAGPSHNFCLVFENDRRNHVLVTPHNIRGVDVSVALREMDAVFGMNGIYDIEDMNRIVEFVKAQLTLSSTTCPSQITRRMTNV